MQRLYFEYMGELIHRNTEPDYKLRYWCLHSKGGQISANTQAEIKQLIRSKNDAKNYTNK